MPQPLAAMVHAILPVIPESNSRYQHRKLSGTESVIFWCSVIDMPQIAARKWFGNSKSTRILGE
jgi:hypothetical protein